MKHWVLVCALILLPKWAACQRQTLPRGSFLATPARSTQGLLKQFDSNREVRSRYMNIFGRSREETREILSRLKPKSLTESHVYPVGYYTKSGQWRYQEKRLAKGTRVFVTPEGKPFLKEECGNPLVVSSPYPLARPRPTRPPIQLPRSLDAPQVKIVVTPIPPPDVLFPPEGEWTPMDILRGRPIVSFPPAELGLPEAGESFIVANPEGSPGIPSMPGLHAPGEGPIWLALLIPLFFLGGGGGGGPGPPGPLIPEPSSWVMMIAGGLGVLAASWRTRSGGK